jgi:hypothetical protein
VLIPGLSNTDAENVFLGTTAAQAVYLGSTMVWPNVTGTPGVMGEQLITNPTNNRYGELWQVSVPAAAVTVDVVMIGGGGGAQDGGTLGSGKGGGVGNWVTATYTIATDYPGRVMSGKVGYGGPGAQALPNFGSSDGFPATLFKADNTTIAIQSAGGKREGASGRTGATPPDCVFNGRTYKGGAGGTSSNKNGVDGQAPGGGGQGGDAEITGTYGGQGGAAGIYLYFY